MATGNDGAASLPPEYLKCVMCNKGKHDECEKASTIFCQCKKKGHK